MRAVVGVAARALPAAPARGRRGEHRPERVRIAVRSRAGHPLPGTT